MKIRNNDELKLFEETLDRCSASVLVVTQQGDQYDLADPAQRYLGIAEMLSKDGYEVRDGRKVRVNRKTGNVID